MQRQTKLAIRTANGAAVVLCGVWFLFEPGFEPIITSIVLAAGFLVPIDNLPSQPEASGPYLSVSPEYPAIDAPRIINLSGNAIETKKGDLLVLTGAQGTAVVELKYLNGCKAMYRWRHAETPRGAESKGTGELFEQYGRSHRDGKLVTDVGGEIFIKAGPYRIEWSCGGSGSGYIYPRPKEVEAYVLPKTSFTDFRL